MKKCSKHYNQGVKRLTNELDIERLLKSIKKSDAAVLILLEHQKTLIEYLSNYLLSLEKPK